MVSKTFAARAVAGLLLGATTLVYSSSAASSQSTFTAIVCLLAVPISGAVTFLSKLLDGRHFESWRSAYPTRGNARYFAMNSLTGALVVAVAAYLGEFLAILLLMAP